MGGAKAVSASIGVEMTQRQGKPKRTYVYDENYNLLRYYKSSAELAKNEGVVRYKVDNCTHDVVIARRFLQDAENEGFTFGDGENYNQHGYD